MDLEEDEEEEEEDQPGDCQVILEELKMRKVNHAPVLLAMAVGLHETHGAPLSRSLALFFETDHDIWRHLPKKAQPNVPVLKKEMNRRAAKKGITKLRKNTAPRAECLHWLKMNPIDDPKDTACIRSEEPVLYRALVDVAAEDAEKARAKQLTANWTGNAPWLRLYCCMTSDAAMQALRRKDNVMEHDELDARNSDSRPETHEEVVARLYNDEFNIYFTEVLPELHSDFAECIELQFNEMPGGAMTAEDVKKKITEARAKLMQIISNWEASGNGFGQRSMTDSNFGRLADEHMMQEDGDNRSNFIRPALGHRIHHLCLWHIADEMGVLSNVLNVLSGDVGADGDNVHKDTSKVQKKRGRVDEEEQHERKAFRTGLQESLKDLAESNKMMAKSQHLKVLNDATAAKTSARSVEEDKMVKYEISSMQAENEQMKQYYNNLVHLHSQRINNNVVLVEK